MKVVGGNFGKDFRYPGGYQIHNHLRLKFHLECRLRADYQATHNLQRMFEISDYNRMFMTFRVSHILRRERAHGIMQTKGLAPRGEEMP